MAATMLQEPKETPELDEVGIDQLLENLTPEQREQLKQRLQ